MKKLHQEEYFIKTIEMMKKLWLVKSLKGEMRKEHCQAKFSEFHQENKMKSHARIYSTTSRTLLLKIHMRDLLRNK